MRAALTVLVLASLACTRKEAPAEASAARAVGLQDPANAPRLVAAVSEVRARCRLAHGDYNDDCDASRAFRALKVTKDDAPTLVAFMEDLDPGTVALGAHHAARHRDFFREDTALATRLVARAEAMHPENDATAPELAGILCRIDREKTQLGARITKLARSAPSEELRAGLVSCLLREAPNNGDIRALTEEAQKSPAELVRRAATSTLTMKPPTVDECRAWAKDLSVPRPSAIEAALEKILSGRKQYGNAFIRGLPDANAKNWCPPEAIDEALATYARRFKEGGLTQEWLVFLGDLGFAQNVSRAQKAKAFAIAKEIYESAPGTFGKPALTAMAQLDPEAARPLVLAHDGNTQAVVARRSALERLEERAAQPE